MLLTIRTTHQPATELGFLLHKHPDRVHTREFPFGQTTVFHRGHGRGVRRGHHAEVDPVGMVRGRAGSGRKGAGIEDQYVNDRAYVASSLLSVVIARWFGATLSGRCEKRPELPAQAMPLEARLAAVPCRGGASRSCACCSSRSATRSRPSSIRSTNRWPALGASRLFTPQQFAIAAAKIEHARRTGFLQHRQHRFEPGSPATEAGAARALARAGPGRETFPRLARVCPRDRGAGTLRPPRTAAQRPRMRLWRSRTGERAGRPAFVAGLITILRA